MVHNCILLNSSIETCFRVHAPQKGSVDASFPCENVPIPFPFVQMGLKNPTLEKCSKMHHDMLCL